MKKINFFLIGMTSVLLAFAMIGCDNGTTTKTEYVNTGGGNNAPGGMSPTEQFFYDLGHDNTAYVSTVIELPADFELLNGQEIVVGTSSPPAYSVNSLGEGPLFADNGLNGTLIIRHPVTLRPGSKVTVLTGGAVNLKTPSNGTRTELLTVQEGATVDLKTPTSLNIEPNAEAHFETGAILVVVNAPSVVVVENPNAANYGFLTIDEGLKVVVDGATNDSTVELYAIAEDSSASAPIIDIPTEVPAAKISDDVKVYATVENAKEETDELAAVSTDVKDQVAEAVEANPEKSTSDVTKLADLLGTGDETTKTVTYTGPDPIPALAIADGKTLIITGAVTQSTAVTITGTGKVVVDGSITASAAITATTLTNNGTITITASSATAITVTTALTNEGTIDLGTTGTIAGEGTKTNNGTIKTATALPATGVTNNGVIESTATTETVLKTHVGASGTGKVVLTGAVNGSGVTAPLALTQNLEIGADGSITYTGTATTAFSATTAKTVKLLADDTSPGKLTLPASITGFGTNVTVTNNGLISTATESGATLNALIAKAGGKIEASGSDVKVAATDILSISKGTILTIVNSGKLTIEDDAELYIAAGAEVIVEGTLVNANGSGGDLIGTITIKSTGTVKDLNNGGGSLWGTNGSGKYVIEKGAEMYRETESGLVISGEANGGAGVPLHLLYLESGTLTMTKTAYVLDGNLTSYGLDLGGTNHTVFQLYDNLTITIKAGKTLTITDFASSHGKDALWVYNNAWILGETGASVEITSTTHNDISIAYIAPPETYNEPKATHPDVTADSAPDNFNFYKTDSTEKAVLIYPGYNDYVDSGWGPYDMYRVAGGTYNWDATAGGTGKAGWKKEAVE